jgi:hypothetical protein
VPPSKPWSEWFEKFFESEENRENYMPVGDWLVKLPKGHSIAFPALLVSHVHGGTALHFCKSKGISSNDRWKIKCISCGAVAPGNVEFIIKMSK